MKKYKALVMDFDLTIADTRDMIARLLSENAAIFGVRIRPEDTVPLIGCTAEHIYSACGVTDPELALRMGKNYGVFSAEESKEKTKFFPDVAEGLRLLSEHGIRCAVCSQKWREQIMVPLRREGIDRYFDVIIGMEEVRQTKPDPEGLLRIAETLGIGTEDILYTGDALTDQKTAAAAGTDFAAMLTGVTPASAFDCAFAAGMFDSFLGLCRAMTEANGK